MNPKQARDPNTGKFMRRAQPKVHQDDNRRIADYSDEFFDEVPRDVDRRKEDKDIGAGCAGAAIVAFLIVVALLTF